MVDRKAVHPHEALVQGGDAFGASRSYIVVSSIVLRGLAVSFHLCEEIVSRAHEDAKSNVISMPDCRNTTAEAQTSRKPPWRRSSCPIPSRRE